MPECTGAGGFGALGWSVKAGGEVVVLDRGTPVARLVSAAPEDRTDARLDELIRSGQVRRRRAPLPPSFWERPRPSDPEGRMMQTVLEERAEGV